MKNEIYIFGDIGFYDSDTSLMDIERQLAAFNGDVTVKINSIGGSVNEGFAIFHALRRYAKEKNAKITTQVTGECASIAVVVLLAGDVRISTKHAQPFVHNPYIEHLEGNEIKDVKRLLEIKRDIAELYSSRANISVEQAMKFMDAETALTAEQCLHYGFITEIEVLNKKNLTNKTIDKMRKKQGIFNRVLQILGGVKNKIVYTAEEGVTLDFFELEETDNIKVGDFATVDGVDAEGTYVADIDGVATSLIFEAGELIEIVGEGDDEEVTTEQVEELIERIEELEAQNKVLKTKNHALNSAVQKIKNLENGFSPDTTRRRNAKPTDDKMDYLTKFKKK